MRTGSEYLACIKDDREIYVDGRRVHDVAHHPAFAPIATTIAELFDVAADPASGMTTHAGPGSEIETNRVFTTPRSVRFVESEYAVPREALHDVLAELRAAVGRLEHPVMFPVEVRVAAADDIWLSTAYR